jgi:hypothetical protein
MPGVTNITVAGGNRISNPSISTVFTITVDTAIAHYIFAYREEATGSWVQSSLINQTVAANGIFNHTVAANIFNKNRRYEIAVQVMTQIPSPETTNETYTGPSGVGYPPGHSSGQNYLQKVTQSTVYSWYVKVFIVQPEPVVLLKTSDEIISVVVKGQSQLPSNIRVATGNNTIPVGEVNLTQKNDSVAASKVRTVGISGNIVAMAKKLNEYTPANPSMSNYSNYSNYSEYLDGTFTSNFPSNFPSRFSSLFPSRFSSRFSSLFPSRFSSRFSSLFPSRFSSQFPSRFTMNGGNQIVPL